MELRGEQISNGGDVFDIVKETIGGNALMQVVGVTTWILQNWTQIWQKLKQGLNALMSWIKNLWNAVKTAMANFWEWLTSLFS
jgi:phage-related protein